MYFNISHIDQKSDGATVGRSTAFDIKRLYLGVDHKFSDMFSASVVTDVSLIANTNTVTGTANSGSAQPGQGTTAPTAFPDGRRDPLPQERLSAGKIQPALTIRLGEANMPWIPWAEDIYGYRFVEPTLIDRTAFGNSADWGVHVLGSFANGLINYQVSVVDGAGYRNPLRSESVDVEGRVNLAYKGFVAAVGGYTGKRGNNTFTPFSPVNNAVTPVQTGTDVATFHNAERFNALLAYTNDKLRIGGEYFWAKNWNQVTRVPTDTSDGWSVYGSYKVTPLFTSSAATTGCGRRGSVPGDPRELFQLRNRLQPGQDRRPRLALQARPRRQRLLRAEQRQPVQLRLPDRWPRPGHL